MPNIIKPILSGLVKGHQPKLNSYFLIMLTLMLTIVSLLFTVQSIIEVQEAYEVKIQYNNK